MKKKMMKRRNDGFNYTNALIYINDRCLITSIIPLKDVHTL